ncbi:hypothetical protein [Stutzerimonas chloritidismutans]|uniref:hypothetical protein n=1 Tax=Stutzerimonas chloritidismutans TaxID=203192 RepID=UPI0028A8E6D9|nr:hypothetical protein [Stutzerimonas chloritidismutans]
MKSEHFDRLVDLSCREGLPLRTYLVMMRRALRHVIAEDDRERQEQSRDIRAFKRNLPWSQSALDKYTEACRALQQHNRKLIVMYGRYLRDSHLALEQEIGWEGLCDVLCVNPVHRVEAAEPEKSLLGITWIGGQFEDSATHYGGNATGKGPITRAIGAAVTDWVISNMDKLPDPFAPDSPFYGVPTYHQQPDGSMARQSAPLVVHDADGSRVVTRAIEVSK